MRLPENKGFGYFLRQSCVDAENGLDSYCDFIISRSKEQLTINVPVMAIIKVKNENIKSGLDQCAAAILAA